MNEDRLRKGFEDLNKRVEHVEKICKITIAGKTFLHCIAKIGAESYEVFVQNWGPFPSVSVLDNSSRWIIDKHAEEILEALK